MDRALVRAKAIGLRGTVDAHLQAPSSSEFDPEIALEWFDRFAPLLKVLHESGEEFADLRPRPTRVVAGNAFEGRGYVDRVDVVRLFADLSYCIDVLTILPAVQGKRSGDAWEEYDPADKADGVDLSKKDAFLRDLRSLVQNAKKELPFALILSDVDHFKKVNDEFGHPSGDRVLTLVAQLVRQTTGRRGRAYRYGGEEFAILLPHFDEAEASAVAERVRRGCRLLAFGANMPTSITLTLGVADSAGGEDPDAIVKRADAALYRGKNSGRDRVVCHRSEETRPAVMVAPLVNAVATKRARPVVMIVDRDRFIRDILGDFLGMDGFITIKAKSALDAIARPVQPPDVVLASLELEDQPGIPVLDLMKRRFPGSSLIAMTGRLDRDVAVGIQEAGATLLEKPFKVENVIATCFRAYGQDAMAWEAAPGQGTHDHPRRRR